MLFLLFLQIAYANQNEDYVRINSTISANIRYGQFIQLIPNTFGMGENNQYPIVDGTAIINLTISSPAKNEFDFFVFDSPYNQFYVCYIHFSERSGNICQQLVSNICQPCPKNQFYFQTLVSVFLQAVMSVQLNYQTKISDATNMNSLCFLGCQSDQVGSFIIANTSYKNYQNAASYMILDNTPFPNLVDCNITVKNCQNASSEIENQVVDESFKNFCKIMRNISCVQQFQNITEPEIQFDIDFDIQITPNNNLYYVQYMVMIILVIIIIFLFIILCVIAMRYKRVKKKIYQTIKKKK
ncbi:unnamed protein product (macronuclear) [Paramecium tetraurelia]|uniref:Transmembrane protein n=1 Tax=Paramecium tetraurelia TaxID=5888 RepID=A0BD74_PARTE|nr:uncharacterized protein GSPATT00004585001 [Paramecium tetraurelia]CAK56491.1 unnamed protein product [Paramecium tetraurelia]|eukprot:XP_001423889.1 hypothetical protein (macronuclear) [Paramecium tetraurelia strain d4-2]